MGIISGLNKAFENRVRLGVMSILMVNDDIDFNSLKEMLGASDGNIASHISAMEKLEYIKIEKKFIGKKTNTSYSLTALGKESFKQHINALENLLKPK
jgi:DNA-binding MarR family transcriptional regulator